MYRTRLTQYRASSHELQCHVGTFSLSFGRYASPPRRAHWQTLACQTIQSTTAVAQTGNYYFNPNSFSNARAGAINNLLVNGADPSTLLSQFTYGTLGRNVLRGPGRVNTDLALSKHFRLFGEKLDAEFRVDAFNIFNHAGFSTPDTNIGDPSFGQISSTADPHILQVALHLKF